jgi:hypothetical protein
MQLYEIQKLEVLLSITNLLTVLFSFILINHRTLDTIKLEIMRKE